MSIGIDFGTCYTRVGIYRNDKFEIINNDKGNKSTPSVVAFSDTGILVGESAVDQMMANASNTVFDIKRFLGRRFDETNKVCDTDLWPFQVVEDSGRPKVQVQFQGETKSFFPEEIAAMIFKKMKDTAEKYLGTAVTGAVISIPAFFNNSQREATRAAGIIAGLNILGLINEPTAAAVTFGLETKFVGAKDVLVFDLGGGTFDVSILTIEDGIFEVKSTCGDTYLGGRDFDERVAEWCRKEVSLKHQKDINRKELPYLRLTSASEELKRTLSSAKVGELVINALLQDCDYKMSLTRAKFEDLNIDLFSSTSEPLRRVIQDSKFKSQDIHEILLTGGSTNIPGIQRVLQDNFTDMKLISKSLNPEEAVVCGAAVNAALLTNGGGTTIQDFLLIDVAPLSLGLETSKGMTTTIIKRNSAVPTKQEQKFTTFSDNQTSLVIVVYEGERLTTKDNNHLGSFELVDIPPAPRGGPQLTVTFDLDISGILNLSAVDTSKGKETCVKILADKGGLSKEEIDQLIKEVAQYKL